MRLAFDVDGVLANFTKSYTKVLLSLSDSHSLPDGWENDDTFPPVWHYEELCGFSKKVQLAAKDYIAHSDSFWLSLPSFEDASMLLRQLNRSDHELLFITNRFGVGCKHQTDVWLYDKCGIDFPTVIITGADKLPLLSALAPDFYIDDKLETVTQAHKAGLKGVYLLDRPWNRQGRSDELSVVATVEEALRNEELWL